MSAVAEAILPAIRALHVAACLSLFGALLFRVAIVPPALSSAPSTDTGRFESRLVCLVAGSFVVALATWIVWLWLQAAAMSGAEDTAAVAEAIPVVLGQTWFGHVSAVRLGLFLVTGLCLLGGSRYGHVWPARVGTVSSGLNVALIVGLGHATAYRGEGQTALVIGLAVHVLAAGAWLGSLAPLALTLATLRPSEAIIAVARFSPLGVTCVLALAVTAAINLETLVGGAPGLGTPYGSWVIIKLALFAVMISCSAVNRFLFTPALGKTTRRCGAARTLRWSVVLETCVGIAIVYAAGMLSSTPPGLYEHHH